MAGSLDAGSLAALKAEIKAELLAELSIPTAAAAAAAAPLVPIHPKVEAISSNPTPPYHAFLGGRVHPTPTKTRSPPSNGRRNPAGAEESSSDDDDTSPNDSSASRRVPGDAVDVESAGQSLQQQQQQQPHKKKEKHPGRRKTRKYLARWNSSVESGGICLNGSLWDASAIIGTDVVGGWAASLYTFLLLAMNLVIQIVFVYLLVDPSLSGPKMTRNDIDALRGWRTSVAHEFKYYNAERKESLASRLCSQDPSLELSGSQQALYNELVRYIGKAGDGSLNDGPGPSMCAVALVVWILTIADEVYICGAVISAIFWVPRGSRTIIDISKSSTELTIVQMSRARSICVIILHALRAALAVTLCCFGSLFIVYTVSVLDILLNAVALEFILYVDEWLFEALAPVQTQNAMQCLSDLKVPPAAKWKGMDKMTVLKFFITFGMILGLIFGYLLPQTSLLAEARDAMCGGDRTFVVAHDGYGAPAWAYPKVEDGETINSRNYSSGPFDAQLYNVNDRKAATVPQKDFYASLVHILLDQHGKKQFADQCRERFPCSNLNSDSTNISDWDEYDRPDCCFAAQLKMPQILSGRFSLGTKSREKIEDAVELWNPSCYDVLTFPGGYRNLVQGAVSDAANLVNTNTNNTCKDGCTSTKPFCSNGTCIAPHCEHVQHLCNQSSIAGVRVRQACPVTCGCNAPRSSLALFQPSSGCGHRCIRSAPYLNGLRDLPCKDVPTNDTTFQSFLNEWDEVRESWPADWSGGSAPIIDNLRVNGCKFLDAPWQVIVNATQTQLNLARGTYPPYLIGINPCVMGGTWFPVRPLSHFCPVACGCRQGDAHCPLSCPARNASTAMCPAHHVGFPGPALDAGSEYCALPV